MSPYRTSAKPDEADPERSGDTISDALVQLAYACAMHNGEAPRVDLDEAAFGALVDEIGSRVVFGVCIDAGKRARYVTLMGPRGPVRVCEVR